MLDFKDYLLLDADNLASTVHISPVKPGHEPTVIE